MRRIGGRCAPLALLLVLVTGGRSFAAYDDYAFRSVADDTGAFASFGSGQTVTISINDHGQTVFSAQLDDNSRWLFRGGDPVNDRIVFAPNVGPSRVNNAGTVVYVGTGGVMTTNLSGASPVAFATTAGKFEGFGAPTLNNGGAISFFASIDPPPLPQSFGIFDGPDPDTDVVASSGSYGGFGFHDMNDAGVIAFKAYRPGFGSSGVFTGPNPATDARVDTLISGYAEIFECAINNLGGLTFRASLDAGGMGVFTGPDAATDIVATSAGPFASFGEPDLNSAGTVAFRAVLDAGGEGLFTGADPVADRVIATGDPLFGSTLSTLRFFRGLNEPGDLAFCYTLADGRRGVAVASVPEPAAAAVVMLALPTLLMRRRPWR